MTLDRWLQLALRYRDWGFKLLPLRPGEKLPAGWIPEGAHGYSSAVLADEVVLRSWVAACGGDLPNLGWAVGEQHLVVDLDMKEVDGALIDGDILLRQALERWSVELPGPTLTQATANGGQHLVYRLPSGVAPVKNAVGVLQCVDLRGCDGYIAVEPSQLSGDRGYHFVEPLMAPLVLPRGVLEAIESLRATRRGQPGGKPPAGGGDNPRARNESVEDYVARVTADGFRLGSRDASFLYLARDLHWINTSEWAAMEIVEDVWRRTDQTPDDFYPLASAVEKISRTYADTRLSSAPDLPTEAQLDWVTNLVRRNAERDRILEAQAATRQLELGGGEDELTGDPFADLDVISAAAVRPEAVDWLWKNWLPLGKLSLVAGMPETGKSTLALQLAATLSTGAKWPDETSVGDPGGTLVLTAEDGLSDTVVPRLLAAHADLERIRIWRGVRKLVGDKGEIVTLPPTFPEDTGELRKAIAQHAPKLIIVDVLNAYLSGKIDSYRDMDIRRALMPLAKLAEETGVAIVGVVHLNKSTGSTVMTRINGSMGYAGTARVVMLAGVDPDDETEERRVFLVGKSNVGRKPAPLAYRIMSVALSQGIESSRIDWEGESAQTATTLLEGGSSAREAERAGKEKATVEWLERLFIDQRELTQREIAQRFRTECGRSEATLHRLGEQLGVQKRRIGFGRGSAVVWIYPPLSEAGV